MPHPSPTTFTDRLAAVRHLLRAAKLDALLVTNPENRLYLTGFHGHDDGVDSAGRVLISQDHARLLTDTRYSEQAREEAPHVEISDNRDTLSNLVMATLRDWGWQDAPVGGKRRALGIEAAHLTVAHADDLRAAGKDLFRLKPTRRLIEPLRERKDTAEIAATRRATEITVQTFAHLLDYLQQPEVTEQQVAAEIVTTMLRLGADGTAFAPIVAGGPLGARPHAIPGDRVLQPRQPIIIDMGARASGYCADMTRTVFLDGVPDVWRKRYQTVLAAQQAAEAGLRAGLNGQQADALARAVIEAAGMGEQFTHGLGHGTGLEIHEDPYMGQKAAEDHPLPAGAIITVEPGVYFPGEGGIRIENAVVLTSAGCDVLTTAPTELDAMVVRRKVPARRA